MRGRFVNIPVVEQTDLPYYSDATKDRFIAMYHVTDKTPARSGALFNATVLELVKLIQASLAIFGMFDLAPEEKDGLLCDVTCEGIQQWVSVIGEPYLKIEVCTHVAPQMLGLIIDKLPVQPTEKVADPTVVAALFSLILSTRSKLHALGLVCWWLSACIESSFTYSPGRTEGSVPGPFRVSQGTSDPAHVEGASTLARPSPPVARFLAHLPADLGCGLPTFNCATTRPEPQFERCLPLAATHRVDPVPVRESAPKRVVQGSPCAEEQARRSRHRSTYTRI